MFGCPKQTSRKAIRNGLTSKGLRGLPKGLSANKLRGREKALRGLNGQMALMGKGFQNPKG